MFGSETSTHPERKTEKNKLRPVGFLLQESNSPGSGKDDVNESE